MISNKKVTNNEVIKFIQIYNFCIDHFSIRLCMNNSKFKLQNKRILNRILG